MWANLRESNDFLSDFEGRARRLPCRPTVDQLSARSGCDGRLRV
jgi:hypothetical protein